MSSHYKDRVSHQSIINRLERTLGGGFRRSSFAQYALWRLGSPAPEILKQEQRGGGDVTRGGGRRRRRCWQGTDRPLPLVAAAPVRRSSAGRGTGLPGRGGGEAAGPAGAAAGQPAAWVALGGSSSSSSPGPTRPCARPGRAVRCGTGSSPPRGKGGSRKQLARSC